MKQFILSSLLLILCATALQAQPIRKMSVVELTDYIKKSEKPLVISFWATWCGSCVEEIPYFISTINNKYKGEVELLLVSLDIKDYYPSRITSFAQKRNFTAPIIWLNESNADVFCPAIDSTWSGAIPSNLMINNKKQYRKFYGGLAPLQLDRELKLLTQ